MYMKKLKNCTPAEVTYPIDIYQPCYNQITKETFRTLSFTEAGLQMQWTVEPDGYVPFEHAHLYQDEIFVIEQGTARFTIDGNTVHGSAGETKTVYAGQMHIAANDGPGLLDCKVTYAPGHNHDKFMQCFMGLTHECDITPTGIVNPAKMGYFTVKLKTKCVTRPATLSPFLFKISLVASYVLGTLLGWNKLLEKYTGETF